MLVGSYGHSLMMHIGGRAYEILDKSIYVYTYNPQFWPLFPMNIRNINVRQMWCDYEYTNGTGWNVQPAGISNSSHTLRVTQPRHMHKCIRYTHLIFQYILCLIHRVGEREKVNYAESDHSSKHTLH